MNTQEVISYLDELLFSQTGKHLDSLQVSILKGVLNGQKYTDIAQDYNCTAGHAKDKAYELWQLLSEALDEDINKSNFRATIERLGLVNSQYQIIGNPVQIGKINLCGNPVSDDELDEELNENIINSEPTIIESVQKKTKLETIPRLVKLGLTAEQIADALDLSLEEVQKAMS